MIWKVYILKSDIKKWYYVGSTNDIERRVKEHNSGKVLSTKGYKPLQLVYVKDFATEAEARAYEQKIKRCRKEKERIIKNCQIV